MTVEIVNIILWGVFLAFTVIIGIGFCITGYKKGLWRALLSLIATFISAFVSIFLSRFAAKQISPYITEYVISEIGEDSSFKIELLDGVLDGAVGVLIAIMLFSLIFVITAIIIKSISANIFKKKLKTKSMWLKLGGLGIRLIDTIILVTFLLLPIYGTLSTYVPIAEKLAAVSATEDTVALEYMQEISNHPVVNITRHKTFTTVYDSLSVYDSNDTKISISEVATTVSDTMSIVDDILADETVTIEEISTVVEFANENLIGQKWFYDLYNETVNTVIPIIESDMNAEYEESFKDIINILNMSQADFDANLSVVLDLASYVLENIDSLSVLEEDITAAAANSEPLNTFITKISETINATPQLRTLKGIAIREIISSMLYEDPEAEVKFLSSYDPFAQISEDDAKNEVLALLCIISGEYNEDIIEEFIGADVFSSLEEK